MNPTTPRGSLFKMAPYSSLKVENKGFKPNILRNVQISQKSVNKSVKFINSRKSECTEFFEIWHIDRMFKKIKNDGFFRVKISALNTNYPPFWNVTDTTPQQPRLRNFLVRFLIFQKLFKFLQSIKFHSFYSFCCEPQGEQLH